MELVEKMTVQNYFHYDVIILGGGQAALAAAISAKEEGVSVALITKGKAGLGGSSVISDGVHSAIFSPGDSPEIFYKDMIQGGRQLSDHNRARILAYECSERVNELESKYGVVLERECNISTPGHSFPRRVYAGKGIGKNITKALREYAIEIEIELFEQSTMIDLITTNKTVGGAIIQKNGEIMAVQAKSTILATGGFGGLYSSSDNPRDVSGEAIGMAWRHGAQLVDMEFVQYYPYRLQHPANIDIMTKLFGKGAILVNETKSRFMENFPRKELETRDILSYEMFKQDRVLLDISKVSKLDLEQDSPYLFRLYKKGYQGDWVMNPVQHYCMGGIKVDEWGRTNLSGLYACGECTGGLHGANRLGGGSLTESLVFGKRTGHIAAQEVQSTNLSLDHIDIGKRWESSSSNQGEELEVIQKVKEIMWTKAGIERTTQSLKEAANELDRMAILLKETQGIQGLLLHDKVRAAWAAAYAGAHRKESRGAHKLQDVKVEKKEWEGNIVIQESSIHFIQKNNEGSKVLNER
jgi:aspartate oxidase